MNFPILFLSHSLNYFLVEEKNLLSRLLFLVFLQ